MFIVLTGQDDAFPQHAPIGRLQALYRGQLPTFNLFTLLVFLHGVDLWLSGPRDLRISLGMEHESLREQ